MLPPIKLLVSDIRCNRKDPLNFHLTSKLLGIDRARIVWEEPVLSVGSVMPNQPSAREINLRRILKISLRSSRAAAAKAQAAGLSGFPLDFGLGLLPLGLAAAEFALGDPGFGAAGAASDFGAGTDGVSTSLC